MLRPPRSWTDEDDAELLRMHALGWTCVQIAQALKRTDGSISGRRRKLGLQTSPLRLERQSQASRLALKGAQSRPEGEKKRFKTAAPAALVIPAAARLKPFGDQRQFECWAPLWPDNLSRRQMHALIASGDLRVCAAPALMAGCALSTKPISTSPSTRGSPSARRRW